MCIIFKYTRRRKNAGILAVFRAFSTEEHLKMMSQFDARIGSYYGHDPNFLFSIHSPHFECFREKVIFEFSLNDIIAEKAQHT